MKIVFPRLRRILVLASSPFVCLNSAGSKMAKLAEIPTCESFFSKKPELPYDGRMMQRLSFTKADITELAVDAIANAAKSSLLGGGGVDGAIHSAAGRGLYMECKDLGGCPVGSAKITAGYNLPAKYVIHCVGPMDGNADSLRSCYKTALKLCTENNIKSIAFPCISTGIYGFPNEPAAEIALCTTWEYLEEHKEIERVIFCCFLEKDYKIYEKLLSAKYNEQSP
nr:MACRO domain containing protein 2 [Hymenolepis microstoma]